MMTSIWPIYVVVRQLFPIFSFFAGKPVESFAMLLFRTFDRLSQQKMSKILERFKGRCSHATPCFQKCRLTKQCLRKEEFAVKTVLTA